MSIRTIYIVGAGFSKTFGLPLADEFLSNLIEESENDDFKHRVNTTCRDFFPNFNDIFGNYPNVEDFYNYNYSLLNYYSLWGNGANKFVKDFVPEFIFEVSKFLDNKIYSIDSKKEFYIEQFCLMLSPGDVIVSFNWDNIIERYLEKYKKPYTFHLSSDLQQINLLKLHGSID